MYSSLTSASPAKTPPTAPLALAHQVERHSGESPDRVQGSIEGVGVLREDVSLSLCARRPQHEGTGAPATYIQTHENIPSTQLDE